MIYLILIKIHLFWQKPWHHLYIAQFQGHTVTKQEVYSRTFLEQSQLYTGHDWHEIKLTTFTMDTGKTTWSPPITHAIHHRPSQHSLKSSQWVLPVWMAISGLSRGINYGPIWTCFRSQFVSPLGSRLSQWISGTYFEIKGWTDGRPFAEEPGAERD